MDHLARDDAGMQAVTWTETLCVADRLASSLSVMLAKEERRLTRDQAREARVAYAIAKARDLSETVRELRRQEPIR